MPNSSSSSSQRHHQSLIGYKLLYGYVKQYCETTESLPNEMQPYLSTVRSLDVETSEILDQLERLQHELQNRQLNREGRESILNRVEELLYLGQLNGDRKIDALTALLDKAQTVNIPLDRFAAVIEPPETAPTIPSTGRGGGRRPTIAQHILHSSTNDRHSSPIITSTSSNVVVQEQQRGRLKRKPKPGDVLIVEDAKQRRSSNRAVVKLSTVVRRGRQPAQPADEPVYCLCQQVSFGEMIGCDNDKCSIEWFHFECVSLKSKPKGKWYCPDCRGDRVNMLRTSK